MLLRGFKKRKGTNACLSGEIMRFGYGQIIMQRKNSKADRGCKGGYQQCSEAFQTHAEHGRSRERANERRIEGRVTRKDIVCSKDRRRKGKGRDRELAHTSEASLLS